MTDLQNDMFTRPNQLKETNSLNIRENVERISIEKKERQMTDSYTNQSETTTFNSIKSTGNER